MPILAASSGIVMPGCPCTKAYASAARVPLPLRRPARRFLPGGRPGFLRAGFVAVAVAAAARLRLTEPFGRPGPRRRGLAVAVAAAFDPPTPSSAEAAASRRVYSSTRGFSSVSRSVISRRFSSRKSVTIQFLFTSVDATLATSSASVTLHDFSLQSGFFSYRLGIVRSAGESAEQ